MLVILLICLFQFFLLLCFLLIQHLCYFVEQTVKIAPQFCRNRVVGHLILINNLLQPLLFKMSFVMIQVLFQIIFVAANQRNSSLFSVLPKQSDPTLHIPQRFRIYICEEILERSKTKTQHTASLRYVGTKLLNFYWPAVSQSWRRQTLPLNFMSLLTKSMPTVGSIRSNIRWSTRRNGWWQIFRLCRSCQLQNHRGILFCGFCCWLWNSWSVTL